MNSEYGVNPNRIWVFDAETDNKNDKNRAFSASPYYEENRMVNFCLYRVDVDPDSGEDTIRRKVQRRNCYAAIDEIDDDFASKYFEAPWLFCGHNVRFDLAYFRKDIGGPVVDSISKGDTLLWDTQFVEYLLSGHKEKMCSLNDLAAKYGLESKIEGMEEFWNAGIQTEDIDPELLNQYVEQDVKITKDIALQQLIRASEEGMMNFILVQLRALFVLHEYEYNGLYVDKDQLNHISDVYHIDAELQAGLANEILYFYTLRYSNNGIKFLDFLNTYFPAEEQAYEVVKDTIDIDSTDKIKKLVFGGTIEFTAETTGGVYKSGKKKGLPKPKKVKFELELPALLPPAAMPFENLTPKGKEAIERGEGLTYKEVSLDDSSIDEICNRLTGSYDLSAAEEVHKILRKIKAYRESNKIDTTYCQSIRDYLFSDSCIHANYNADLSATGRLTSSNPNLQNQPSADESNFKTIFTSRFDGGSIGVVDFKQLEVVGLAYLSGDEQLTDDLLNERDVHEETAREAGLVDPFTGTIGGDDRRTVKGINFGTIYGAGVKKLAQQSKIDTRIVQDCVDALKNRYPQAFGRDYIANIQKKLMESMTAIGRDNVGMTIHGSNLWQPTGRKIWFETEDDKYSDHKSWPYTKMRNYPVQSFAYDIVTVARIMFYDEIRGRGLAKHIKMVNEVHDEIVFDMDNTVSKDLFGDIVDSVEERLAHELTVKYDLEKPFELPLKLEVGVGESWKSAK